MPDTPPQIFPLPPEQQQSVTAQLQAQPPGATAPSGELPVATDPSSVIPYGPHELRQLLASDPWFPLSLDQSETLRKDDNEAGLTGRAARMFGAVPDAISGVGNTISEAHKEMQGETDLPRVSDTIWEGAARGTMFWRNLGAQILRNLGDKFAGNGSEENTAQAYHERMLAAQRDERLARGLPDERPANFDPSAPTSIIGGNPYNSASDLVSFVLPPSPPVLAGAKNVLAPLAARIGQGALKTAIATAARVPGGIEGLEKVQRVLEGTIPIADAINNGVGAVTGLPGKASQGAAGLVEKTGGALKAVASAPGDIASAIGDKFFEPEAKETAKDLLHTITSAGAVAGATGHGGPVGMLGAGLKAGKLAGSVMEQTGAFLRHLAGTEGDQFLPRLLQVAAEEDAPSWVKSLAGAMHDYGIGTAAQFSKDLAESGAHGAATGFALGELSGQSPEQQGQFMGAGIPLAVGGRLAGKALGADRRMRAQAEALKSYDLLLANQHAAGTPPEIVGKISDGQATIAGRALQMFRGKLDFRFLDPSTLQAEAAKQGQPGGAAWFGIDPQTGRDTIYASAGDKTQRALHELGHAIAKAVGADGETRLHLDSVFSPQQIEAARRDYAQKLVTTQASREGVTLTPQDNETRIASALAALDSQPRGQNWIYDELYADAGFGALKSRDLRDITRSSVWQKLGDKVRGKFFNDLGAFIDPETGERTTPGGAIFSNPDLYNDPGLRRMVFQHLRDVYRHGPGADTAKQTKEGVPAGAQVPLDLYGKHPAVPLVPNPATGQLENDAAVKNARGEVTLRKPSEILRIERTRQAEVDQAFNKQPVKPVTDTTPEVSPRKDNEGKTETSGTKITSQLSRLPVIGEEARKNAALAESVMGTGNVIDTWYQAIGTGHKWYKDVKRRLGNIAAAKIKLAPFLFKVSKEGNVLVVGLSLTAADRKIAKWQANGKLDQHWGGDAGLFKQDLFTYLRNHAEGKPGETGLDPRRKNLLNVFVIGDNRAFHDLNPLRDTLRGEDKQGIVRSLRLDRMASAEVAPDQGWFAEYEKKKFNLSPEVPTSENPQDYEKDRIIAKSPEGIPQTEETGQNAGSMTPLQFSPETEEQEPGPVWYSQLEKTLEAKMPARAAVGHVKNLIDPAKGSGVKADEVKWTGLDDWLNKQNGSVTKEEVLNYLRDNQVKVEDVVKGGEPALSYYPDWSDLTYAFDDENGDPKYDYAGELSAHNDRDSKPLITVWAKGDDIYLGDEQGHPLLRETGFKTLEEAMVRGEELAEEKYKQLLKEEPDATQYNQYQLSGPAENYREILFTLPANELRDYDAEAGGGKKRETYQSSHWEEPNVLAHTRISDRMDKEGRPVLLAEEIQSDWHQAGRKKGYKSPRELPEGWTIGLSKGPSPTYQIRDAGDHFVSGGYDTPEQAKADLPQVLHLQQFADERVADAPFKKNWPELVFRRLVRLAAEEGKDRLAWINGEQQADRYNLAKQVDAIRVKVISPDHVLIHGVKGEKVIVEKGTTLDKLPDFIGKELAQKVKAGEGEKWDSDTHAQLVKRGLATGVFFDDPYKNGGAWYIGFQDGTKLGTYVSEESALGEMHTMNEWLKEPPYQVFTGNDLKVGGAGMRGFYDKILVDYANKFGKKWGVKVEPTYLESTDYGARGKPADWDPAHSQFNHEVHSLPITPEMRKSVNQGQALFSPEVPEKKAGQGDAVDNPPTHKDQGWGKDFPKLIQQTTVQRLTKHKDWEAGKDGDLLAALRVASELVRPAKLAELHKQYPDAVIVPLIAQEAKGRNKHPLAYAAQLEKLFPGWTFTTDIIQANRAHHTGKDVGAADRMVRVPVFDGPVESGKDYILVDDVVTSGGTLAAARRYIQERGGKVVAATGYAASFTPQSGHAGTLAIQPETVASLKRRFDIPQLERLLSDYGIADKISQLANSQGRYLASCRSIDSLRSKLAEARVRAERLGSPEAPRH